MMDPLLLVEIMENNPHWEVRYLEKENGIFIGPDDVLYKILEEANLELEE